jgi:hypothetical protein
MNVKICFSYIFFIELIYILVKMRLRIDNNDPTGPLTMLKTWRDKKYKEIDEEYNHKVEELNRKISIHDNEITRTISNIQELLNEGDVSIDQVKQMQKTIEILTNQVNNLLINESSDLIGTYIQLGSLQYLVKARILCQNIDLYALESEMFLIGHNGICPQCNKIHIKFESNRGMYALAKTVHAKFPNLK